jgi:cholesterol transport system auxiliary component
MNHTMHLHAFSSDQAGTPRARTRRHAIGQLMVASAGLALAGCGALQPSTEPTPAYYTLEPTEGGSAPPATASPTSTEAPSLLVLPPRSTPGYDSQRIIYLREPHRLEYFARSEWVDPPARMLGPLMVQRLQRSGAFRAVVLAPSASRATLQLETQVLRLQHEFLQRPSQVRFGLRATLSDSRSRAVLGTHDFEAVVVASEDTPYGGVRAAHQAVQQVLDQLDAFCRAVPVPPRSSATSGTLR